MAIERFGDTYRQSFTNTADFLIQTEYVSKLSPLAQHI